MSSLRLQLGLLLLAFTLLVAVSAGATVWGLQAQGGEARLINLAGRQRMLVQQIVRLAGEVEAGRDEQSALATAADTFEQTLGALQAGGQAVYLPGERVSVPAAQSPEIQAQLERVAALWAPFRADLEIVLTLPAADPRFARALSRLESRSEALAAGADAVVRLYQTDADRQVRRLRWIQLGFLAGALVLLGAGSLVISRGILKPLQELGSAADRIGAGDLTTPVAAPGPQEIQRLAGAFEAMRSGLAGSQAALVDSAAALEGRVLQRTRELEALHEVSREISSRLELDQVLRSVADKARELLGAEVALLCLLEPERQILSLQALSGPPETILKVSSSSESPFALGVLTGRCAQSCTELGCPGARGILTGEYRTSHLAAPLRAGERVIGALCVGSRRSQVFSGEAAMLLTRLANAAAVALENARLYAQADQAAALEERQRIAAKMHDGLAQMVNYVGLMVDQAGEQLEAGRGAEASETLSCARRGVDRAEQEVRRSIASLQEDLPPTKDLQQQLRELSAGLFAGEPGRLEWSCDLADPVFLSEEDTQQVLGVAREALQNALRYSGAARICLALSIREEQAVLRVQDDGCGFDPLASLPPGRPHFGLEILRARAARLDGMLEIRSAPGQGTSLSLTWPLVPVRLPTMVKDSPLSREGG